MKKLIIVCIVIIAALLIVDDNYQGQLVRTNTKHSERAPTTTVNPTSSKNNQNISRGYSKTCKS